MGQNDGISTISTLKLQVQYYLLFFYCCPPLKNNPVPHSWFGVCCIPLLHISSLSMFQGLHLGRPEGGVYVK